MAATTATQEIIDRVRIRIQEPTASGIVDTDVAKLITEAQRDLLWRLPNACLWPCTASTTTNVTAAKATYTFETTDSAAVGFLRELSVLYKTKYARRWEQEDIDKFAGIADIKASETNPFYFITATGITFSVGSGGVTATGSFTIVYVKTPTDVNIGSSPIGPTLTSPYFPMIEDFVVARCWENRGDVEGYARARAEFLDRVAQAQRTYMDTARYQGAGKRG